MNAIEDRARLIFLAALERSADDWATYLDEACGGDAELRCRTEKLLRAHDTMGSIHGGGPLAAPLEDSPIAEGPGTMIGPYKLVEQIGEGGMGVVFLAEQERPVRRKVALKIVKPGMDTREVIGRFEAERQALAMMDHPNIAKVFDAVTVGEMRNSQCGLRNEEDISEIPHSAFRNPHSAGRPFFVMELVQGVPITEYCDECQLTTRDRLELFVTVCRAVQHAHQKGIIHRDIKPTNVLVAMQDGRPTPKIIDFGVAKAIGGRLTDRTLTSGFAQMLGTPLYMSPEQAELSPLGVDTRSDVYSLGVLLYELLTGATPFDKDRLHTAPYDEVRRIIREEEPPRPSARISTLAADAATTICACRRTDTRRLVQSVRGELDWIVMKALDKDRSRRYESASALAEDVHNYLRGAPVLACPPSLGYRLRKFAGQHRGLLAAAATVLLALSVGLGIAVWQATVAQANATRATQVANQEREARQQAQANLQMAIEAVNDMYSDLALNWINSDQGLTPLQGAYLEKAAAFYTRVLANPEQFPLTADRSAEMAWRSARALRKLGRLQQARRQLEKALPRFADALAAKPDAASDESLGRLVDMHNLAGVLARQTGDLQRSRRHLEAAAEVCQQLLTRPSAETMAHRKLGHITTNLSSINKQLGDFQATQQLLEQSLAHYERAGGGPENLANYLGAQANMSDLLLQQGKPAQAEAVANKALKRTNMELAIEGADDRMLREVQALLLLHQARSLFIQQKFSAAETVLENLMQRQVALMSTGVDPPTYGYAQFLGMVDRFPGFEEPAKWSDWTRSLMMLAEVKLQLDQPVAAENLLSRALPVAKYLAALHKDSESPRHLVDKANLQSLTALVLKDRYPNEAAHFAAAAAESWQELLAALPALESKPAVLRGGKSDFAWFVEHFPEFDPRHPELLQANKPVGAKQSLDDRGTAQIQIELEDWQSAAADLKRAVAHRQPPEPYDLLTLSLALIKLDQREQARTRYDEALELLQDTDSPEPVVESRQRQVARLLDERD